MQQHIRGFQALAEQLATAAGQGALERIATLRESSLEGVEVIDRHSFRISLTGKYPQFAYWLAMPFFAPMPWEAEIFYAQPGMAERNITLDWYPVGTGPFMLSENNPNLRMVLTRNRISTAKPIRPKACRVTANPAFSTMRASRCP
jgi:oligopeptide transport system substrate-binding protein